MAQHAIYDHHETHEQMKMNFQIGMDELVTLEKQIRDQFVAIEKLLKIDPAVIANALSNMEVECPPG